MTVRCTRLGVALVVLAVVGSPGALAADPVLFEEAASGILELAGHSRLEIIGFTGTVFVRAGKQGELRYSAATRTARRVAHPVALWLQGGTIIFRPVAGRESDELILEIALSEGVRLSVEKHGGKVQVASVLGDVSVRATESEVDIRGAGEQVSVELEGGTLRLENLPKAADVRGTDVAGVELLRSSYVTVSLSKSAIRSSNVGGLTIDLSESTLDVDNSSGHVSGTAIDSRLALVGVRGGGKLALENTPLELTQSRGAFEIETDAEVKFAQLEGSLDVTGFGAGVIGDGHSGEVSVGTRDARVSLKNIGGPVVLTGDALNVELVGIRNMVTMELIGSEVTAERVTGGLDLSNEFGDVAVSGIDGPTKIVNSNGNVKALELSGSAEIEAAGPEVHVGWKALGRDRNSRVENSAGDVYIVFGPADAGAVEAQADSIETDLEELEIGVDGRSAKGLMGEAKNPTVSLRASGRLVVSRGP